MLTDRRQRFASGTTLLEQDGRMQVVLPYFRARKVAVMSLRSEGQPRGAQGAGREVISLHLPLEGGGRRAPARGGWG